MRYRDALSIFSQNRQVYAPLFVRETRVLQERSVTGYCFMRDWEAGNAGQNVIDFYFEGLVLGR